MKKEDDFMKCDGIQDRLTSYLDLELSVEERQAVKEHLSICSLCAGELNELKKVGQWVHLIQEEPDPYFEKQVLRVVRSSRKDPEKGSLWNLSIWNLFRFPVMKRTAMAFVFLVAVLSAYYLGYQSRPFWVAKSVGIPERDLEKINQEIDFYKDYEIIHQLDLLKKMDQEPEKRGEEKL